MKVDQIETNKTEGGQKERESGIVKEEHKVIETEVQNEIKVEEEI